MATQPIRVEGLRELQKAARAAGKATKVEVAKALRESGGPVRDQAQRLAVSDVDAGYRWSRMRIGSTMNAVYVAPAARRSKGSPRPNFGGRLLGRAMMPALEQKKDETIRRFENALDVIENVFERGA